MNKIKYNMMKKKLQLVASSNDKEAVLYLAQKAQKNLKWNKLASALLILTGIPLSFIIVGVPMIIMGIVIFFQQLKTKKRLTEFMAMVETDPEFS